MPVIDQPVAWDILSGYVADCLRIDPDTLLAVYAIGSLSGGYYRPGQSDIDAVLLVKDGSEHIWGTPIAPSEALADLNRRYLETYQIPKDFGPFPIQESRLFPPYLPDDELVPEIARLKVQGEPVFGSYDLDAVPMPMAADLLEYARHFERWFEDEFLKEHPFETFSPRACVNTMLMHMSRFLWVRMGEIEFDKRKVLGGYLASDPPFADEEMLPLVDRSLAGHELSEDQIAILRRQAHQLRVQMNAILGVSPRTEAG